MEDLRWRVGDYVDAFVDWTADGVCTVTLNRSDKSSDGALKILSNGKNTTGGHARLCVDSTQERYVFPNGKKFYRGFLSSGDSKGAVFTMEVN